MFFYRSKILLSLILILLFSHLEARASDLFEEETIKYEPHGYLDFNTYHDTRNFQVNTLNAFVDLPGHFSYFSFTNWSGDLVGADAFDYNNRYGEYNLFYDKVLDSPFDLVAQYAEATGKKNNVARFGIQANAHKLKPLDKILKKINTTYKVTYFPVQIDPYDDYAFQLQHVWSMKIFPKTFHDRVYMAGFADHNFMTGDTPANNKAVVENQLGLRLWNNLYAVTELRWNGYYPKDKRFGVGLGLEYRFEF